MSQHARAGIIQHHTGYMQHPTDHIDRMLRAFKMFLQLSRLPARKLYLHIVPCVDVNLLDPFSVNIFCQEAKFRHLGINSIDQLLRPHPCHTYPVVLDILSVL